MLTRMSGDIGFDPSREWLGIAAVDLADPFRVLGVAADACDEATVEAAAERLLAKLRGIAPGPFRIAHEALVRRIETCREQARAVVAARPPRPAAPATACSLPPLPTGMTAAASGRAPHPAPPPVPNFELSSGPGTDVWPVAPPAVADLPESLQLRPPATRRRRATDPLPLALSLLAFTAAGVAAFVLWPRLDLPWRNLPRRAAALTSRPADPVGPPLRQPGNVTAEPVIAVTEVAATPPTAAPPPVTPTADPPASPPPGTPPSRGSRDRATAAVDNALRQAFAAIRNGDFDGADRLLAAATDLAKEDTLADRIMGWKQLARYGRQFTGYREEALNAVKAGDYEVRRADGSSTRIAVIESTPERFVYKSAGRTIRVPRTAIPGPIVTAIVRAWFAAADQPGNHVFLGVHALSLEPPDTATARAEWSIAARGGENVSHLERLLADPIIQAATAR